MDTYIVMYVHVVVVDVMVLVYAVLVVDHAKYAVVVSDTQVEVTHYMCDETLYHAQYYWYLVEIEIYFVIPRTVEILKC